MLIRLGRASRDKPVFLTGNLIELVGIPNVAASDSSQTQLKVGCNEKAQSRCRQVEFPVSAVPVERSVVLVERSLVPVARSLAGC
jgi:hypothetical protein